MVSRGEKETKQEIKARAARDEFEGGVGHLTARGEDGAGRGERRFWSFGDMCCRYGHRRRRTGEPPPWTSKSPPCWSKMAPRLTRLFDIPFPAAAARRPESGHSEFLTNTAAATELPSKRVGGRERDRGEIFLPHRSLVTFPIMQKQECSLSFPRRGGLSAVMTSQKFFRLGDEKQRRLGKNGRGQKDRLAGQRGAGGRGR